MMSQPHHLKISKKLFRSAFFFQSDAPNFLCQLERFGIFDLTILKRLVRAILKGQFRLRMCGARILKRGQLSKGFDWNLKRTMEMLLQCWCLFHLKLFVLPQQYTYSLTQPRTHPSTLIHMHMYIHIHIHTCTYTYTKKMYPHSNPCLSFIVCSKTYSVLLSIVKLFMKFLIYFFKGPWR